MCMLVRFLESKTSRDIVAHAFAYTKEPQDKPPRNHQVTTNDPPQWSTAGPPRSEHEVKLHMSLAIYWLTRSISSRRRLNQHKVKMRYSLVYHDSCGHCSVCGQLYSGFWIYIFFEQDLVLVLFEHRSGGESFRPRCPRLGDAQTIVGVTPSSDSS